MTFLIILVLIVAGVVAYKNRVPLMAKIPASPSRGSSGDSTARKQ